MADEPDQALCRVATSRWTTAIVARSGHATAQLSRLPWPKTTRSASSSPALEGAEDAAHLASLTWCFRLVSFATIVESRLTYGYGGS